MPQYDNVPSATWNMQNQQPLNRGFNHQSQPQPIGEEWQTGALASPTMHPEFAPRHYVTHETEAGAPDASHVRMNDVNELRRMANGQ